MSDQPLLVYSRIERNKRLTRVLLLALALAMLPSVSACAVLAVPFVALAAGVIAYAIYGPALDDHLKALDPPAGGVLGLSDLSWPLLEIISPFGAVALAAGFCVLTWYGMSAWEGLKDLADEQVAGHIPTFIRWWGIHAMLAPLYAVVVAPLLGLVIRQCVSRQREFLADADAALLTRDPAGLANALIKIGRARGERLAVGEGSVHLYFVDPEGEDTFLHRLFPSHPPLQQRIALLARMAQGVEEAS